MLSWNQLSMLQPRVPSKREHALVHQIVLGFDWWLCVLFVLCVCCCWSVRLLLLERCGVLCVCVVCVVVGMVAVVVFVLWFNQPRSFVTPLMLPHMKKQVHATPSAEDPAAICPAVRGEAKY